MAVRTNRQIQTTQIAPPLRRPTTSTTVVPGSQPFAGNNLVNDSFISSAILPPTGGGSIVPTLGFGGPSLPGTPPPYNFGTADPTDPGQVGSLGAGACAAAFQPGTWQRIACDALAARIFGGGDTSSTPTQGQNLQPGCPTGYEKNAAGECVESGFGGMVRRTLPGGQTGTLADSSGQAVVDQFGNPAMVPMQVGTITRNDGTVSPILRCGGGMVLGKNDLCYMKGTLPRAFRKWAPAPKPPMSAADAKALRRIATLQNRVKKLAKGAGFTCKKR